jgi:Ricin-type beta-trefoil lectin domain-like
MDLHHRAGRRLLAGSVLAATAALATGLGALPAHADVPAAPNTYLITTIQDGLALEPANDSDSPNAALVQATFDAGLNQYWTLVAVPSQPGVYELVNADTGLCVNIWALPSQVVSGSIVVQDACTTTVPTDLWTLHNTASQNYQIESAVNSNLVLSVIGGSHNAGTALDVAGNQAADSQQFYFHEIH